MSYRPRRAITALGLALALLGCNTGAQPPVRGGKAPAPGARATATPPAVLGDRATLRGAVRLIAGAGGKLGTGGALLSDAGAGVISDHGGGIISNNSGAVVSNGGASYRLRQAAGLAAYALAEAVVVLTDARGNALKDAAGKAIEARTDASGDYAFTQDLPKGAMVARIKLFNGGELQALVVNDGTALTVDLDTASTLGAAYVLDRLVIAQPDPGAVLAKLPRAEAERLHAELGVASRWLAAAPGYDRAGMAAAADALRGKVPAVHQVIEEVRGLLLGQAQLGAGLPATEVALAVPVGLLVAADGTLTIGEQLAGRLRQVGSDGKMRTLMDAAEGTYRTNVLRLADVAAGPDGTLWVASQTQGVYALAPGATQGTGAFGGASKRVSRLAVTADGTVWLGEYGVGGDAPRLLARRPDGSIAPLVVDPAWEGGRVAGLAAAGETLWVLYQGAGDALSLYEVAGGVVTKRAAPAEPGAGDLAIGPDGTLYLSQPDRRRVVAYGADGTLRPVAGAGGAAGSEALRSPGALAVGPDGTLYMADEATSMVWALAPGGGWRRVAGTDGRVEAGETTRFALNQPGGVAFDAAGDLLIAETGAGRVRRYRGGALEPFAGDLKGFGGDGGPATAASLEGPRGLWVAGGETWIADAGNGRLRRVGADGGIATAVGDGTKRFFDAGASQPATAGVPEPFAVAVDAAGRAFFSSWDASQVYRLADGQVTALVGPRRANDQNLFAPGPLLARDDASAAAPQAYPAGLAFGPDGALYFAEMLGCRVVQVDGAAGPGPATLVRVAGRPLAAMIERASAGDPSVAALAPDGVPALETTLVLPTAIAFDAAGAMYVAEAGTVNTGALSLGDQLGPDQLGAYMGLIGLPRVGGRVRKIGADGKIRTIAGVGGRWLADASGPNALQYPVALAIAKDGRLAIADQAANAVHVLPSVAD